MYHSYMCTLLKTLTKVEFETVHNWHYEWRRKIMRFSYLFQNVWEIQGGVQNVTLRMLLASNISCLIFRWDFSRFVTGTITCSADGNTYSVCPPCWCITWSRSTLMFLTLHDTVLVNLWKKLRWQFAVHDIFRLYKVDFLLEITPKENNRRD